MFAVFYYTFYYGLLYGLLSFAIEVYYQWHFLKPSTCEMGLGSHVLGGGVSGAQESRDLEHLAGPLRSPNPAVSLL